jgi:hypothetical protein
MFTYARQVRNLRIEFCPVCHIFIRCLNYSAYGIKQHNGAIVNMQIAPLEKFLNYSNNFNIISGNKKMSRFAREELRLSGNGLMISGIIYGSKLLTGLLAFQIKKAGPF